MVIRKGIAGMTGAVVRLIGLALFLYGAALMSAANPQYDPLAVGIGGLAIFAFVGPFVKNIIETILLVD